MNRLTYRKLQRRRYSCGRSFPGKSLIGNPGGDDGREEGDDDGILQAIEILKSMLSTHLDEIELTEPTENGGFDETFKGDWE